MQCLKICQQTRLCRINNYQGICFFLPNFTSTRWSSLKTNYNIDLQLEDKSLNKYVNHIKQEYADLTVSKVQNKRLLELQPIARILERRERIVENLLNLNELLNEKDAELQNMAEKEKSEFLTQLNQVDDQLLINLFPKDECDSINAIVLEVQAGVGGQEAMLFAKEIFEMYCNFCEYKGWDAEIAEYTISDTGGLRHASALVNGESVYRHFKHEAGVHRVQRTPVTEKAGRIHTSTISVKCLPQPADIEININPKDLKIETKRSSGAGGQHVNTTDSCVRITHLPTNISVECQVDRSQIKNRKMAMARLNALLYQKELDSQLASTAATRKSQVRSNFRNEKIRTYNFNQDRITDHRLKDSSLHNLKTFLEGGEPLAELIEKLDYQFKVDSLLELVNCYNK